ncbi:4-hydroxy-3-methylbut-2-enyl diphosphate reductase [Romboutsia sedimentorum]|uniref:4-hydroxy-3-methylbut-2-enyl diphosphate reductase n=1 Tax=Romboutsia sedimentorum TaxID=1368474 RepID=A0ABT7E7J3_9FIRM|nr:4-hydroxy-3-methylbut-2-enyl diphosphate reductase [Romboutsia sedimentorum]MDK2561921.1 4-hydroxy-3-methylbut-2-enyl diphosphate reductase [Romboutsia sedimentorum]MDK2586714.1 4-hydroxy-3-methylbut-2-enyl diphosphate reductase [Romboutsia sedimentorum]
MNVKIAKEAGFCFGVKRAMKMAWNELETNGDIYALGPIIHNKQAVSKYEEKGLKTVEIIDSIPNFKNMIIRSHGVGEKVYKDANEKQINVVDTTCPYVKKIHRIVKTYHDKGYEIIVIGDSKHPEVIGINGWCGDCAKIIKTLDDLDSIKFDNSKKHVVVAQTTINLELYNEIISKLDKKLDNIRFNNTICSATKVRQLSAKELSQEVDCMVVVGGKHSSNTQKLVNICRETVETFAIETKQDLNIDKLKEYQLIGITAGASTPDWIIEDVVEFIESI